MSKQFFNLIVVTFIFSLQSVKANNIEDLYEKADQAYGAHQYNSALIHLKNLTQQSPEHVAARLLMAEVLLASGQPSSAEVELAIAQKLGADKQQLSLLFAKAAISQSQYNQALSFLEEDANTDELSAKIYVLRGVAQLGLRQLKLSQQSFLYALKLAPANRDAKLGLAKVYVNYFDFEAAQNYLNEVLKSYFPPIEAWVLKAHIAQSTGNNVEAKSAINEALALNPEHVDALILRASLLLSLGENDQAIKDINVVLKLYENEPRASFLNAVYNYKLGAIDESEKGLSRLVDTVAQIPLEELQANPSYLYLVSTVLYHQNKLELAEEYITEFLTIDQNNSEAMAFSAMIKIALNKLASARSLLIKANLLTPNNAKVVSLLGLANLKLNDYEEAKFYFLKAKSLAPNASVIDTHIAKTHINTGNFEQAIERLLSIESADMDQITISFLLIEAYVKSGKFDQAEQLAEQILATSPDNPDFIYHKGFISELAKKESIARKYYERAISVEPKHAKSIASLAQLEIRHGQVNQALTRLNTAITDQPDNLEIMYALAKAYNYTKQHESAINWYKKAFRVDSSNFALLEPMVLNLLSIGRVDEAIEQLESFVVYNSESADAYVLLSKIFVQKNEPDKALDALNSASKVTPNKGGVYFSIAQTQEYFGRTIEAVQAYKKSIGWNNSFEPAKLGLGRLLNNLNRSEETIDFILEDGVKAKESAQLQGLLADAYLKSKQFKKAERLYKQLKNKMPERAITKLSLIYTETKQPNKAKRILNEGLAIKPQSLLFNTSLAEIYIAENDWSQANTIYKGLVNTYSKQPAILNNAAYIALNIGDFERAKSLSKASLAITGDMPDSLDTLGWIYYQTEEFDKALPLFRKALAIDNSKLEVKYHLSLTLKKLNRHRQAFTILEEVVNSKQEFVEKAEAKNLLANWAKEISNN